MNPDMVPENTLSANGNTDRLIQWLSPYQDERFTEAAHASGLYTDVITQNGKTIHFFGDHEDQLTAWEVNADIEIPELPPRYTAYQHTVDANPGENTYSTLALTPTDPRFSRRFLRNTAKASKTFTESAFKELPIGDLRRAAVLFEQSEQRGDFEPAVFDTLIHNLAEIGLLRCFVLEDPTSNEYHATSLVLSNEHQANLRFYSARRDINGTGHLLQKRVIDRLFEDGVKVVDQSGFSPTATDSKLKGINEFKQQIGGSIVTFEKYKSPQEGVVS